MLCERCGSLSPVDRANCPNCGHVASRRKASDALPAQLRRFRSRQVQGRAVLGHGVGERIGGCYQLLEELTGLRRCATYRAVDTESGKELTLQVIEDDDESLPQRVEAALARSAAIMDARVVQPQVMAASGGVLLGYAPLVGLSLATLLEMRGQFNQSIAPSGIAKILCPLAEIFEAVHAHTCHGSLCLDNVIVGRDGLRLADVYLCDIFPPTLFAAPDHAFTAPELLSAQVPTAATDVFACGVILQRLTALGIDCAAAQVMQVDEIIRIATAKDPAQRFGTPLALVNALSHVFEDFSALSDEGASAGERAPRGVPAAPVAGDEKAGGGPTPRGAKAEGTDPGRPAMGDGAFVTEIGFHNMRALFSEQVVERARAEGWGDDDGPLPPRLGPLVDPVEIEIDRDVQALPNGVERVEGGPSSPRLKRFPPEPTPTLRHPGVLLTGEEEAALPGPLADAGEEARGAVLGDAVGAERGSDVLGLDGDAAAAAVAEVAVAPLSPLVSVEEDGVEVLPVAVAEDGADVPLVSLAAVSSDAALGAVAEGEGARWAMPATGDSDPSSEVLTAMAMGEIRGRKYFVGVVVLFSLLLVVGVLALKYLGGGGGQGAAVSEGQRVTPGADADAVVVSGEAAAASAAAAGATAEVDPEERGTVWAAAWGGRVLEGGAWCGVALGLVAVSARVAEGESEGEGEGESALSARELARQERRRQREVAALLEASEGSEEGDACPTQMRRVAGLAVCIDQYEFPGRGHKARVWVDLAMARRSCVGAGKRLCRREEWQQACGVALPYGRVFEGGRCNDASGGQGGVVVGGQMQQCRTRDGLFDMAGNVAEWVEEGVVMGGSYLAEGEQGCRLVEEGSAAAHIGFRCCMDVAAE